MTTPVQILRDLVAIPSVSSLSNVPVINYAVRFLEGWKIARYPYADSAGAAKLNLVASTGRGRAGLALVCHTDTVPFDPDWADAVNPRVQNGKLYGRGSCDVKGFLACVLSAITRVDLKGLARPLAVVLTADEEIGCVGAKLLAKEKALRAESIIIGEPTGLRPIHAGKGYGLAEIVIRGKEAHSAFPSRGRSAIVDAARVVLRLQQVARKLARHRNRDFDPPYTTLNAGLIRGGSAKNIVPGECRVTVEWRPVPGQDANMTPKLIREELVALRRRDPGFSAKLEVKRIDPPFEPSQSRQLVGFLESITRRRSATVSFGTEAAHLRGSADETVVFGPGDMTAAHKSGEFVPVADLDLCVKYLTSAIEHRCGA